MPKILKLRSLLIKDPQEGGSPVGIDNIRLIVVLDGTPVRKIGFDLIESRQRTFTDDENLTDTELTEDSKKEFIFWSLAEITAYEADTSGIDAIGIDTDIDEWVQTVRLDHRLSGNGTFTIKIGKKNDENYLSDGRNDAEWIIEYSLEDFEPKPNQVLLDRIANTKAESEKLNESTRTGDFKADKGNCKWICSIDGGGLRGIFPLRLLEQLERYYNKSCFEMFDMFAGTSTGSIIAALLAAGYSLKDAIAFYANEDIRKMIFRSNKKGQNHAFKYFDLRQLSGNADDIKSLDDAVYPNKYIDLIEFKQDDIESLVNDISEQIITPRYRKTGIKELLFQGLSKKSGDRMIPLKLNECKKDIFITARDLNRNETTFFTSFHIPFESSEPREDPTKPTISSNFPIPRPQPFPGKIIDVITGTYNDVFLKDAVEASASAPVYFSPRSQFSDGGIGAHNNPSFMAAIEALKYSNTDLKEPPRTLKSKYTPYQESRGIKSGTVVWSFGTSYGVPNPDAEADIPRTIGGSQALRKRNDTVIFWIGQVIDNLMFGANQEQDFLCRNLLKDQIKYLRFNLGVNNSTIDQLGIPGDRKKILSAIRLDSIEKDEFSLMDSAAKHFALFARNENFGFNTGGYEIKGKAEIPINTYKSSVISNFNNYQ